MHGRIADELVKLQLGLGAHNGFVGRADGAVHPVEAARCPLAVLARGLVLEIVERKGDVCRHALQQRHDLLVQRPHLALGDHEHADDAAAAGERHRRRRADLALARAIAPGQRTDIVKEIVTDANLAVAKRLPADAGALGCTGYGRYLDAAQPGRILAKAGREPQQAGLGLEQEDRGREKIAAGEGGFADLPIELLRRFRIEDRLVGGVQRR